MSGIARQPDAVELDRLRTRLAALEQQRDEMERALRVREERLSWAQAVGRIGDFEYDAASGEMRFAEQVYRLLELDSGDEAPNFEELANHYHERDAKRLLELFKAALARGVEFATDCARTHRDGRVVRHSFVVRVVRDEDGRVALLRGTIQDVTERLEAMRDLDNFFQLSQDMLCVGSTDGWFKRLNPAFERVLGHPLADLYSHPYLDFVHPDDCARTQAAADDVARGLPVTNFENRLRCRDGGYRWLSWSTTRPSSDGLVFAVARDVTAQKQLDEQLLQAQKMEVLGQLAGGVAHDFNNLLTAILGNTELLLSALDHRPPSSERLRTNLQEIQGTAQRAALLTRQLLAFSRKEVRRPEVVDPRRIVAEMQSMLSRLIGKHVRIAVDIAADAPCIRTDLGQLEQLVLNLAVNAADAMPEGGTLTIRLRRAQLDAAAVSGHRGAKPGPYLELTVADTGVGMPQDVIDHIFEPFFTTKPAGKGTGIGLSTVYKILQQSGGHVDVQSAPGLGTTFRCYFPAATGRAIAAEGTSRASGPKGGETILLCEDDPSVREVTRFALRSAGYRVLIAEHAKEAMELAERHGGEIELLLTDVMMPGLNGRELGDRLRHRHPHLKTLLVSGYAADQVDREGIVAGQVEFLQKPYSMAILRQRVRDLLDTPAPLAIE